MTKAYSHFAALALSVLAFSSCSRTNYATNSPATPLTQASVAQVPVSPAAEMSAQVVAPMPTETVVLPLAEASAPVVAPVLPRVAATSPKPATLAVAKTEQPAAQPSKPSLVQRLALKKVAKQLAKVDMRHQNTASTEQTAAHSGSLTILLVGLVVLLVGILISSGLLTTVGSIIAVVGLILLLLKAL